MLTFDVCALRGETKSNIGQRLTAPSGGRALKWQFYAVYGSAPATEILLVTVAIAPARGGGQALPGGLRT